MNKILPIFLLILGETLAIYAEMYIAGNHSINEKLSTGNLTTAIILMALAGIMLLFGYLYGYKAFNNIWIIPVISITTIVIIEPILALMLFRELPSKGTVIGFILGSLGLFATLYK